MVAAILLASGVFAATCGCWRGYAAARGSLAPLVREGDPTRALVEATRPLHARTRVRLAFRRGVEAVAWLCVAVYGTYLMTVGLAVGA